MSRSVRSLLCIVSGLFALALAGCTDGGSEDPEPARDEAVEAEESPGGAEAPVEEPDEEPPAPILVPTGGTGLEREVGHLNLADVLGDDLGWVTVGNTAEPGDRPTAVFASSDNGVDWAVDQLPAPAGSEHRASKVVRIDGTTVVIGATRVGPDYHLVLWVGEPGDWELRELDEETGAFRAIGINGATVTDDNRVLVVGSRTDEDGTRTPHTWLIDPAGDVEHAPPFDGPGLLRDVAVIDDALFAVGESGDDDAFPPPVLLRSADGGGSWQEVATEGLEAASLRTIQKLDGRYFIGGLIDASGDGQAQIWASSDATSWERLLSEDRGTSHVNQVHRFDGQLVGLGTWLEQTDPGSEDFRYWYWPGAGERGAFGASAQHDGRIVAVGSRENYPTGLMTTTDLHAWQPIDLAAQVLENVTGITRYAINDIATSPDELMLVGVTTRITTSAVTESLYAGRHPSFESDVSGIRSSGASFGSVVFHEDVGWIAVGYDTSERAWWDGPRAAMSADGDAWTEIEVEETSADRILDVVVTADRVLAFGLGWVDNQPEASIWALEDGTFVPAEVEGLGEWVPLGACARDDHVLLHTYRGGAARAMAVSSDGGHTFEMVEDGPVARARGIGCDIDDQGHALIVVFRTGDNEVHAFDLASGDWTALPEATEGARVSITRTVWIADLGWHVIGSRVEVEDAEPLIRRSTDLQDWQDLTFDGDPSRASATNAAATDDELFVFGWVNSEPEVWSLPRADLE